MRTYCPTCGRTVPTADDGTLRAHNGPTTHSAGGHNFADRCDGSGQRTERTER